MEKQTNEQWEQFKDQFDQNEMEKDIETHIEYSTKPRLSNSLKPLIDRAIIEKREFHITTHIDHDDYLELQIPKDQDLNCPAEETVFELRVFKDGTLTGAVQFCGDEAEASIEYGEENERCEWVSNNE